MSGKRPIWSEQTFKRYLEEGRGQGTLSNYIPWLGIRDLPKTSGTRRVTGWKTNRAHVLTKLQYDYFLLLEWSDNVMDIRENYPMLPREEAMAIAGETGINYPVDPASQEPLVLTTDFLLTVTDGNGYRDVARSVINQRELEKRTVLERLELTRKFWQARGVRWELVTESKLPRTLILNIKHVHAAFHLEATPRYSVVDLVSLIPDLKRYLNQGKGRIKDALEEMEEAFNLDSGTALHLFTHLVARKEIVLDMHELIDITKSVSSIQRIVMTEAKEELVGVG
jgi:hypothetical protein